MANLKKVGTTGSVGRMEITENNKKDVLDALRDSEERILTMIGIKVEKYAKYLCPVGTVQSTGKKGYRGGTLRNSITFVVEDDSVTVGTNVEYAPYVELGTGPYFQAPPSWEKFDAPRGSGIKGSYVRPRPYLKPAIVDHVDEYKAIFKRELGK